MLDYLQRMLTLAANKELQGIHFWASVYVGFVLCGTALHILRVRQWPSVTGRLLQLGIRPLGALGINESGRAHQDFIPSALYEYEVGGQQYRGSELSIWKMSASGFLKNSTRFLPSLVDADTQAQVQVYYNPKRPHKSVLLRPGWFGLGLTLVGLILVPAFYVWRW